MAGAIRGYALAAIINTGLRWLRVEALLAYQRATLEVQVRARLADTLNDPDPAHLPVRGLATLPLVAGAPRLQGVPKGLLSRSHLSAAAALEEDGPAGDEVMEKVRRQVLVQGETFTVRGVAEFAAAADAEHHEEQLLRRRFFPVREATLTMVGFEAPPWTASLLHLNRDRVLALYLH